MKGCVHAGSMEHNSGPAENARVSQKCGIGGYVFGLNPGNHFVRLLNC
jgi:hypothetical protein